VQYIKQEYRALLLLFASLIIGQLILAVVLYFFIDQSQLTDHLFFRLLVPALIASAIIGSRLFYRHKIKHLKSNLRSIDNSNEILDIQEENFSTREIADWFSEFKQLKSIQIYAITGCNIIALLAWLFTHSPHYFLYFFIGMTYFALVNPFMVNFYKDFKITEKEKNRIENQLKK